MLEVGPFRIVDLNSQAYALRHYPDLRPVNQEPIRLVDILMGLRKPSDPKKSSDIDRPFGIIHCATLEQSWKDYALASYLGKGHHVWIGVDKGQSEDAADEIQGLFSLDRRNRRILFDPTASIPTRDFDKAIDYYGYEGRLEDALRELEESGIPFMQITKVSELIEGTAESPSKKLAFKTHIDSRYHGITGLLPMPRPYRIEGEISLDNIVNGRLLEVGTFQMPESREELVRQLAVGW